MRVVGRSDIRSRPFERPPRNIIRTKRIRTRIPIIIYRYILFIVFVHDIRTMTSRGSWCACSDHRDIVFHVVATTALCVIFSREREKYISQIFIIYTRYYTVYVCIQDDGDGMKILKTRNGFIYYYFFSRSFHNAKPITTYKYVGRQNYTHTQYAYGITFSIRGGYPMFMYNARKHPKP